MNALRGGPYKIDCDFVTYEEHALESESNSRAAAYVALKDKKGNMHWGCLLYTSPCGFTEEQAVAEASRCLECGCHDYFECKLIDFANQYDVHPERFAGEKSTIEYEDDHPFIVRDPNKCILCGLCVRVCDEVMGVGALGPVSYTHLPSGQEPIIFP